MKNFAWKLLGLMVVLMFVASACTTVGHEKVNLGGGDEADVVWKTSAFGTDGMGIRFKSNAPNDPDVLRLGSYESHQSTTQTYDQKCPDPRQLKNIRTTTVNEQRTAYQDVPNPNKRQDQIAVIGGTNPSTGNLALPAAISGGSFVAGNAVAPGTNIAVNAVAKGSKMIQGQTTKNNNEVVGINNNEQAINLKNKAINN